MSRLAAAIIALLAGVGGLAHYFLQADPLLAELNRRWPPATVDQQRQAAVDSAASTLRTLDAPNLAAGIDVATIKGIVFDAVKSRGVTKLDLATGRQLLQLTANFDLTLTPDDLPKDSNKRSLVAALAPHVVGEVDLFLTAAVSVSNAPQRTLLIKLLPAVRRVHIDRLTVKGGYDVTAAADAITFFLSRYADNLSGALSASPFMNVSLPATLQDGFDPSGPIRVDLNGAPGLKLSLSAHPIKSPFGLRAAAVLIDGEKVIAIAGVAPLDKSPPQTDVAKASFEDVKAAFKKSLEDGLAIADPPTGVWAALGKALVAQSLDSAFAQAQPCLDGTGPIPRETFSAKIPTPDGSGINCTPTRDCTPSGDCTPTKDCSGYKWYQAPDKLRCEAEKSGAKLDCERLKSQRKLQCEAEKTGQKAACEAEKGVIVALHRTGNIGNVDGSVVGMGSLKLCFRDVHFSDPLDKLTLTVAASGSATIDTHFKFVPLDVGGHILCPFEWTADKNITTSVPLQSIGVSVALARKADAAALAYQGRLDELPIKLHFQPSPLSLVLQNVNFQLACPATAGLINGLTLGVAPFIPELLKNYTYKLKPVAFSFVPDLPAQSILGRSVKPKLSETPLALVVSGTP